MHPAAPHPTRKSALSRGAALAAFLLVAGCGSDSTAPPDGPSVGPSVEAEAYINEVVDVMQANSIARYRIDWGSLRAQVLGKLGTAQTVAATYPAIQEALRLLGDGHSSYRARAGTVIFVPTRQCRPSGAPVPTVPADIGYVRVGSFSGSGTQALEFANGIQSTIRTMDQAQTVVGWIVDLRGNGGGNMWPMIAGLGPLLGENVLGFFYRPDSTRTGWEYSAAGSRLAGNLVQPVTSPYVPRQPAARIAVLQDNGVASSGEATLIAFRQRAGTRFFGEPTCGLSTANAGFTLSDGALLNLSVAVMADRTGTRYGDTIFPDEHITDPAAVVARAITWLQTEH